MSARDEDDGAAGVPPDLVEFGLQDLTGLGVERTERSSISTSDGWFARTRAICTR